MITKNLLSEPTSLCITTIDLTSSILEMKSKKQIKMIPIFEVGEVKQFLISFLLPCYANALVVNEIDDNSSIFLNTFCCIINPIAARSIVRKTFMIPGTQSEDCVASILFPCCSINQLLQTVRSKRINKKNESTYSSHDVVRFLSHEIRTPSSIIAGNLSMLEEDMSHMCKDTREKLQSVSLSFATSTRLLNQIMLYEKIEKGLMLNCEFVLVSDVFNTVQKGLNIVGLLLIIPFHHSYHI